VALCLISVMLLMPVAADAGVADIITLLNTIIGTLQNSVGEVLSGIQTINTTARNFEQQVVWPVTLINQTKAEVAQVRSQFTSLAGQIQSIPTNSANLSIRNNWRHCCAAGSRAIWARSARPTHKSTKRFRKQIRPQRHREI
jgi:hypothetical protein